MPETPEVAPLLVIVGPPGSGKSDLSLAIAAEYGGEVVNCDSVQIYRWFDVGSAKLPLSDRRSIPHHLIDICGSLARCLLPAITRGWRGR